MSAIDSQLDGHGDFNYHIRKEEELLADYNDRIGITASISIECTTEVNHISTDGPNQLVRVVNLLDDTDGFTIEDIDGNNIYYSIDYSIISEDEVEDILNEIDMINVYGATKITASIDSEIIDRANEVVDYLNSHNRNLNRKQEQLIDELANAINSKSISGIRSAIEDLKYNSKNFNNKQYALVIDLYDDFNLANGKFNGMGKVESSTNATISASNNPFIRIYIEEGRDLTPKAYRAYLDSGKVIGVIGGEYYIADNQYGKNAKYMGDFFSVKKYFEDLASINPITSATNPQADDYRLLDRLKSDCDYVLNNYTGGKLAEKHLWAGNAEDQIAKMYELYDSLKVKPEWITRKDIDEYARRFEEILNQ